MKQPKRKTKVVFEMKSPAASVAFWLTVSLLVLVPIACSTSVHRMFSLPKFTVLLVGTSALVPLISLAALRDSELRRLLASKG